MAPYFYSCRQIHRFLFVIFGVTRSLAVGGILREMQKNPERKFYHFLFPGKIGDREMA